MQLLAVWSIHIYTQNKAVTSLQWLETMQINSVSLVCGGTTHSQQHCSDAAGWNQICKWRCAIKFLYSRSHTKNLKTSTCPPTTASALTQSQSVAQWVLSPLVHLVSFMCQKTCFFVVFFCYGKCGDLLSGHTLAEEMIPPVSGVWCSLLA